MVRLQHMTWGLVDTTGRIEIMVICGIGTCQFYMGDINIFATEHWHKEGPVKSQVFLLVYVTQHGEWCPRGEMPEV